MASDSLSGCISLIMITMFRPLVRYIIEYYIMVSTRAIFLRSIFIRTYISIKVCHLYRILFCVAVYLFLANTKACEMSFSEIYCCSVNTYDMVSVENITFCLLLGIMRLLSGLADFLFKNIHLICCTLYHT